MRRGTTIMLLALWLTMPPVAADGGHGGHAMAHGAAMHGGHDPHDTVVEIPEGGAVPGVKVEVLKDPMEGWNLHVRTTDFRFAPERVSGPVRLGEGHGHIYLNGKKVNRLYGAWYHLGTLPPGRHEVKVHLAANNHAAYSYRGKVIEDTAIVDVAE